MPNTIKLANFNREVIAALRDLAALCKDPKSKAPTSHFAVRVLGQYGFPNPKAKRLDGLDDAAFRQLDALSLYIDGMAIDPALMKLDPASFDLRFVSDISKNINAPSDAWKGTEVLKALFARSERSLGSALIAQEVPAQLEAPTPADLTVTRAGLMAEARAGRVTAANLARHRVPPDVDFGKLSGSSVSIYYNDEGEETTSDDAEASYSVEMPDPVNAPDLVDVRLADTSRTRVAQNLNAEQLHNVSAMTSNSLDRIPDIASFVPRNVPNAQPSPFQPMEGNRIPANFAQAMAAANTQAEEAFAAQRVLDQMLERELGPE